jgi:outer membrane protein OmpA-like peptidoglycan-associated protein
MNSTKRVSLKLLTPIAFAGLAILSTAACHSEEPAQAAPSGLVAPYDPPKLTSVKPGEDTTKDVKVYNVYYGDSVRHICAGPDPYFAFDSSQADSDKQPTLQVLATCMKTGPLAGKRIELTGRADPRGSEEYNEKLGLHRAERVKRYLVANGVDASRIDTASLGKTDAKPAPEDWAKDRRVQIELAP